MNDRAEHSPKYISIRDRTILVADVFRFAHDNNIPIETLNVSDYSNEDVCRHWTTERLVFNNGILYRGLPLKSLAGVIQSLDAIDLDASFPIIVGDRSYVIDGAHRLLKAVLSGRKTIRGINLYSSDIDKLITSLEK